MHAGNGPERPGRAALLAIVGGSLLLLAACSDIERAQPRPRPTAVEPMSITVSQIMRGTISADAGIVGYQRRVVRGYGLVVGLDGTGSRDVPPFLREHMRAIMEKNGIGSDQLGAGRFDADDMLNSADTAIVVVEAALPPGASQGTRFDVRVFADPRTGATSLEGGRLYTTELRPMTNPGLPPTGARQAFAVARASGDILLNPFAQPGEAASIQVNTTVGRILNGGVVTRNLPMKLRLANPSYTKARTIQDAINGRFPREPGQRDDTARGESDEALELTVPPSYRDEPSDFVELVRHTSLFQAGAGKTADSIKRLVLANPEFARSASWRWEALGQRALPIVQSLYDFPEELPRLAALRAGARLQDPLVVAPLVEMIQSGSYDSMLTAVQLLALVGTDPYVSQVLRDLASHPDVDIRLEAYEALAEHRDPALNRRVINDSFVLDVVPSDFPMIYVTQTGLPRIVLFGRDVEIRRPIFARAWGNRFIANAEPTDEQIEIYFREADATEGAILNVDPDLVKFVEFLGHEPTAAAPAPGLAMTFGETTGILFELWRQDYLPVDFKVEQDRIRAAILRSETEDLEADRPEFSEGADPDFDFLDPTAEGEFLPGPDGNSGGNGVGESGAGG